jgi:hypothetical protein
VVVAAGVERQGGAVEFAVECEGVRGSAEEFAMLLPYVAQKLAAPASPS